MKKLIFSLPILLLLGFLIQTKPEKPFTYLESLVVNQLDTRFWDESRQGDYVSRPITGRFEHESHAVLQLTFANNKEPLGVTNNHPIWSLDRNGWVEAGKLKIGEKVKTYSGELILQEVTKLKGKQKVYNLEIYRDHNFMVSLEGILVHNGCTKKASEFILTHSEDVIKKIKGYEDILKLSDEELINSVMKPIDGQGVVIHGRTGKVVNGNTRIYELKRRGIDVDVPYEVHDPKDLDYFLIWTKI